jgi:hypothetical protein
MPVEQLVPAKMDAVKTIILWPLSVAKSLLLVSSGAVIALIPLLFRLLSAGPSSLQKFPNLFHFLDNLPLGQVVFSSIVYLFAPYSTNIGFSSLFFLFTTSRLPGAEAAAHRRKRLLDSHNGRSALAPQPLWIDPCYRFGKYR